MRLHPPLYHDLLLGIELNRIATLSMHDAEEAVLPPAKREVSHRSGDSDVDPNIPRRSLITEAPRRRAARGKERSLVPIRAALQKRQRLIHRVRMDQTQHRPKDLGMCQLAIGGK